MGRNAVKNLTAEEPVRGLPVPRILMSLHRGPPGITGPGLLLRMAPVDPLHTLAGAAHADRLAPEGMR